MPDEPVSEPVKPSQRLLVYVGGLIEKEQDSAELFDRLRQEPGHEDDVLWIYPKWLRPFTRIRVRGSRLEKKRLSRLAVLADELNHRIGQKWEQLGAPDEIVLIGHSAGGVLLRYAYLRGLGRLGPASSWRWAAHVARIVLIAAPNRGVAPDRLSLAARLATVIFAPSRTFAAMELLSGSPFMTNLRLEWVRHLAAMNDTAPLVMQVRGESDPLVEEEDSRDVVGRTNAAELRLPLATHNDIVKVSGVPEDQPGERYDTLRRAIQGHVEPTNPPELPGDEAKATSIVFLLHGIRAGIDTWVQDLGSRLQNTNGDVLVIGKSYGRFSAFNFALPGTRRGPLRWFQDLYSYYAVRHPGTPIHFVGHSNGTYMFGESIQDVRALRFDRVYLAGSVLPRAFEWQPLRDRGQIGRLVNACGTKDKPVAWLCSGLRGVGMRDIGVGGFTGFNDVPPPPTATQFLNLDGGHGAGLTGERLLAVAEYIKDGTPPTAVLTPRSAWFELMSRLAPLLMWALILLAAGAVVWTVLAFSWLKLLILLVAVGFIYLVLKVV